ncbi:MAG: ribonuclease Z [Candidatus Caldarchaeum sp.]|nr:ribonuclease Z [Candidatus Caldarchaeum sp.]MCS7133689.1 ribonuclease Z [Candidatus Caldarchaeum sp.]MCX8200883.1 ribonuclease Z [Candidatus Caldarchaeum sp.]MDW8062881.1 ribonuclease Z [Candidatus Caldarchaeum sp.]MDW8435015.1 ribonuclease Z [Candidatus Caldarchaeum sp.]
MRIVFLGTSGGMPTKKRGLPSIAVRLRSSLLLLDCGEGTQRQFINAGIGTKPSFHIFLTHLHGDHVLGVPGLLFTLSMNGRKQDVHVYGPPNTADFLKAVLRPHLGALTFKTIVNEMEPGDSVKIDNVTVSCFKTDHTAFSLGYVLKEDDRPGRMKTEFLDSLKVPRGPLWGKLQRGTAVEFGGRVITPDEAVEPPRPGRKIVYTGDTRPCESVVENSRGADVLIHDSTFEASLRQKAFEEGHSTAEDAAKNAAKAAVKRLYLFHISPRYEETDSLLIEARSIFPESYIAEDLHSYSVPYP